MTITVIIFVVVCILNILVFFVINCNIISFYLLIIEFGRSEVEPWLNALKAEEDKSKDMIKNDKPAPLVSSISGLSRVGSSSATEKINDWKINPKFSRNRTSFYNEIMFSMHSNYNNNNDNTIDNDEVNWKYNHLPTLSFEIQKFTKKWMNQQTDMNNSTVLPPTPPVTTSPTTTPVSSRPPPPPPPSNLGTPRYRVGGGGSSSSQKELLY